MSEKPNLNHYVDEYVVEDGIQRFQFPKPQTFVCTIKEPHFVKTSTVFVSDKKKGAFIFCPEHHEFFDVSWEGGAEEGD